MISDEYDLEITVIPPETEHFGLLLVPLPDELYDGPRITPQQSPLLAQSMLLSPLSGR